ncbi:hypothetical protein [Streptomyces sp. NPDC001250]|uniref:hypothetical protein n=1 Tax=unclassified Streptomyces TaxID=2593676 RepID=UPI00332D2280
MEPYAPLDEIAAMERLAERVKVASNSRSYASEEMLDGPMFSVTTSSSEGMHHILDISPQQPVDSQESVHPGATESELTLLRSAVRAALDVMGHEFGAARTTVAITDSGPRIATIQLDDVSPDAAG